MDFFFFLFSICLSLTMIHVTLFDLIDYLSGFFFFLLILAFFFFNLHYLARRDFFATWLPPQLFLNWLSVLTTFLPLTPFSSWLKLHFEHMTAMNRSSQSLTAVSPTLFSWLPSTILSIHHLNRGLLSLLFRESWTSIISFFLHFILGCCWTLLLDTRKMHQLFNHSSLNCFSFFDDSLPLKHTHFPVILSFACDVKIFATHIWWCPFNTITTTICQLTWKTNNTHTNAGSSVWNGKGKEALFLFSNQRTRGSFRRWIMKWKQWKVGNAFTSRCPSLVILFSWKRFVVSCLSFHSLIRYSWWRRCLSWCLSSWQTSSHQLLDEHSSYDTCIRLLSRSFTI